MAPQPGTARGLRPGLLGPGLLGPGLLGPGLLGPGLLGLGLRPGLRLRPELGLGLLLEPELLLELRPLELGLGGLLGGGFGRCGPPGGLLGGFLRGPRGLAGVW